ncbi:hypothetical protein Efla_006911 [Eimeria flavescens]
MSQHDVPSGAPEGGAPDGAPAGAPSGAGEEAPADAHAAYLAALKEMSGQPPMKLELAEIQQVAEALGNPQAKLAVVHVAGTNGKGSVCSKIAACLMAKGLRVGVFTSPHLLCLRERFAFDGRLISEGHFVASHKRVTEAARAVGVSLTFFECCTLIAFDFFASMDADWAVIETGLGGRLDATNILANPRCCVITSIGWDHMDVLGDSLDSIAAEKAGIFKRNTRVVLGPSAASLSLLWEQAAALQCDVWDLKADPRGEDFDQENSRIASLVAQDVLSLDLPPTQLAAALATRPPLRAEWLSQQQLSHAAALCSSSSSAGSAQAAECANKFPVGVVVDVGHNLTALDRLLQVGEWWLQMVGHRHYGCPVRALVCLSKGRSPEVLEPFLAHLSFPKNNRLKGLHVASADHPRALEAFEVLREVSSHLRLQAESVSEGPAWCCLLCLLFLTLSLCVAAPLPLRALPQRIP